MAEIIRPHQICFHVKVSLSKETSPSCLFNHFSKVVHVFLAVTGVGVKSSSLAPSSFFFTGVVSCLAIFRNWFSMTEAMVLGFHYPLEMEKFFGIPFKSIDFDLGAQHNIQWTLPPRVH